MTDLIMKKKGSVFSETRESYDKDNCTRKYVDFKTVLLWVFKEIYVDI